MLSSYCHAAHGFTTIAVTERAVQVISEVAKEECAAAASALGVELHLLKTPASELLQGLLLL